MNSFSSAHAGRRLSTLVAVALLLFSTFASAGIANTRHNLGSSNTIAGTPNKFSGTAEVCVFCHTPHGGDSTAAVPIWNRTLTSPSSYTRYSSLQTATFDAGEAPIGSISIACLSCHDGTQSMNVMINTPGSGSTALTGTWSGTNVNSNGTMKANPAGAFPNLGTNLANDHPVGMQYGGGGISLNSLTAVTKDIDFAQASNNETPSARSGASIGQVGTRILGSGTRVWWVETDGVSGQSKLDMTLYTRSDGTLTVNSGIPQPFVECGTCHDPHSENPTFLRIDNAGSAVCLTCHNK